MYVQDHALSKQDPVDHDVVTLVGAHSTITLSRKADLVMVKSRTECPTVTLFGRQERYPIGVVRHHVRLTFPTPVNWIDNLQVQRVKVWGHDARVVRNSLQMDSDDLVMTVIEAKTEWEQL